MRFTSIKLKTHKYLRSSTKFLSLVQLLVIYIFDLGVVITTRKHRHTEGKNRRYVIGITLFRGHTDEKNPRKYLLGNSYFLGIPSEISDGIPRKQNSEETPRTQSSSEGSSEYTEGRLPRNISMEFRWSNPRKFRRNIPRNVYREIPRNFCPSENSEELSSLGKFRGISVPRKIPRNFLPSENSEGNKFLGIFRGTAFPRNF